MGTTVGPTPSSNISDIIILIGLPASSKPPSWTSTPSPSLRVCGGFSSWDGFESVGGLRSAHFNNYLFSQDESIPTQILQMKLEWDLSKGIVVISISQERQIVQLYHKFIGVGRRRAFFEIGGRGWGSLKTLDTSRIRRLRLSASQASSYGESSMIPVHSEQFIKYLLFAFWQTFLLCVKN